MRLSLLPRRHLARSAGSWAGAALVLGPLLVAGCFNPFDPRVASTTGISKPPPDPSSAVGVLRLYEWCWNERDPVLYREIFTDDYQFQFAQTDSAGNAYRDPALTREEELDIAANIFVRGTATEPPPVSISLTFYDPLYAYPDGRRGKTKFVRWRAQIAANTLLRIEQPDIQVQGTTLFFVVRGDSAVLPQELIQRGFARDSTRWYVERIEDETLNENGQAARAPAGTHVSAVLAAARARRIGAPATLADFDPVTLTWGQVRAFWDDRTSPRAARY